MGKIRMRLMNFLLHSVCNTMTFDEVLSITRKRTPDGKEILEMKIGDKLMPDTELKVMIADCSQIKKLHAWSKLLADMRSHATERLVNKSESIEDMVFAKAILYTLDVLEKKVDQIAVL